MASPYLPQNRGGNMMPVTAFTRQGSNESLVNSAGELNAGSKRELMQVISSLQSALSSSPVAAMQSRETAAARSAKAEQIQAAFADRSGESMVAIGEAMADEIWETSARDGFSRKILTVKELQKGEQPRISIRKKDVTAVMNTSTPFVTEQVARQYYLYPSLYTLACSIRIDEREILQSPTDLLDDKYTDGLEQIMVQEDKITRNLLITAAPVSNDRVLFTTLTPAAFSAMRTQVQSYNIPVTNSLIAFDIWNDILTDPEFSAYWDPVHKYEMIAEGSIGALYGVNLITDGFRYDTLKVLNSGEVFMLGAPMNLGTILQQQALVMNPVNDYVRSRATRGWFGYAIQGTVIGNTRAVAMGSRM